MKGYLLARREEWKLDKNNWIQDRVLLPEADYGR
jgi:hypothetical protein